MGYTHYWGLERPLTEGELLVLAKDAKEAILLSELPIRGWDGTGEPQLGPKRIAFNGDEALDQGCETFSLDTKLVGFDFCKTRREPYDVVVTAMLLILKSRHPDIVSLNSDGGPHDWTAGRNLAERIIGHAMPLPTLRGETA